MRPTNVTRVEATLEPSLVCRTPCRSAGPKAVGWSGLSGRPSLTACRGTEHDLKRFLVLHVGDGHAKGEVDAADS